jgi:hypothetical protein
MRAKVILTIGTALLLLGCESPEVKRTRGGGRGADLGHRDRNVDMHEGADPYYQTPQLIDSRYARAGNAKNSDRLTRQ